MRNRLIYICSPLRGDIEKNIQKAQGYCREAVELWPDVIPIAPHVYCTQFLDDTIPQEREAGMELDTLARWQHQFRRSEKICRSCCRHGI